MFKKKVNTNINEAENNAHPYSCNDRKSELYFKLTSPDSEGLTDEEFEEYKKLTTESVVNERKVLKVGSSQPPMGPNMMGDDPNMMGAEGEMPMDDEMNPNMMEPDGSSEFDTNFDAGVEADEDEDPKKYIQQLTGKLSQELGKYNNELGEPDIELNKYVGGMIVKQVAKNLDDKGRKELIKKINTSETNKKASDENLESEEQENLENEMPMESYCLTKNNMRKLFETFNQNIEKYDEENLTNKNVKITKSNKPFSSPKFKK